MCGAVWDVGDDIADIEVEDVAKFADVGDRSHLKVSERMDGAFGEEFLLAEAIGRVANSFEFLENIDLIEYSHV